MPADDSLKVFCGSFQGSGAQGNTVAPCNILQNIWMVQSPTVIWKAAPHLLIYINTVAEEIGAHS